MRILYGERGGEYAWFAKLLRSGKGRGLDGVLLLDLKGEGLGLGGVLRVFV